MNRTVDCFFSSGDSATRLQPLHDRVPDGSLLPLDVKVGDKVLFGKYAGQVVKVDNEQFLVLREDDIMAIVDEPAPGMRKAA